MKLYCENNFCIYEQNGNCVLDYIEIDTLGHCRECIILSIDESIVEELKKEKRSELE